jgi:hypothetical protein
MVVAKIVAASSRLAHVTGEDVVAIGANGKANAFSGGDATP